MYNEISVVGRLKTCSNFWKNNLHVSNFIQKIIDEGYLIPFKSVPPAFFAKNNKSSLDNSTFVQDATKSLLSNLLITKNSNTEIWKLLQSFSTKTISLSFDLTSRYHHVDIHPEHKKYLGFHWLFPDGQTKYFIFNCLAIRTKFGMLHFYKNIETVY